MIATIRREWECFIWLFKAGWAEASGRWHYFRDAPMHVVAGVAAQKTEGEDEFICNIVNTARAELALRESKIRREIEKLHAAIHAALATRPQED